MTNPTARQAASPGRQTLYQRFHRFTMRNFLTIGITLALGWSLLWPELGAIVAKPEIGGFRLILTINVLVIYTLSGLTLETDDIASTSARLGYAYGVFANLILTSTVGFIVVNIPFAQAEFSYGLAVFCVVPTTLSSAITMVMQVSQESD